MKKLLTWIGHLLTDDRRNHRPNSRNRCHLELESLENRLVPSAVQPVGPLIFNEDFNQPVSSMPATNKWTYNTGTDPNNTAVRYVDDSSTLSVVNDPNATDGKALGMTIYPTSAGNQTFNSARINTSNQVGGNIQYGVIEARIKLPGGPNGQGDGLWPAFWMLGSNHVQGVGWPNCGEIDIMEQGIAGPGTNFGSTHFGDLSGPNRKDTSNSYTLPGGQSFYSGYHTFAIYWTPGAITFSVDGNSYGTVTRNSYSASLWDKTFQQPYYLILNICDGGPNNSGGFGGPVTKNSTFPQTMNVDYVRAYALTGITTPTNLTATAGASNLITLSWQHAANDETGFILQRSKTADFATIDGSFNLPQGTTTYRDATGSAGTTYYYRLQAVATDGNHSYQSGYSNAAAVSTAGTIVTDTDLALNRPAFASSLENNSFAAANAVDNNSATRWSSRFSDPQWYYVDLGATFNVTEVKLNWERAAGKNYLIQVSSDAVNWTTIATISGNTTAGVHDYTALSGTGRYVRMYGTARATPYGYSLYDFKVYGVGVGPGTTLLNRTAWKATASSTESGGNPQNALDGGLSTRWSSGKPMTGGEWFQIDLGSIQAFSRIVLNAGNSVNDFARGYQILVSNNGTDWVSQAPAAVGTGNGSLTDVTFAGQVNARYVRIAQTGTSSYWWSIAELTLYV